MKLKTCVIEVISLLLFLSSFLIANNNALLERIKTVNKLSEEQFQNLSKIFHSSGMMGQGNPKTTKHPVSKEQCLDATKKNKLEYLNSDFEKICGAPYMAPLYDPEKEKMENAKVCIDQFEFPDIPCEYPVIWVRANEAEDICRVIGKRLCDAHEWEGACAGKLKAPDYRFDLLKKNMSVSQKHKILRRSHNRTREKIWSYGKSQNHKLCGTDSTKGLECNNALVKGKGVWESCGSNTYPVGCFPKCKSSFEVYDIHGNAAEHMNLPFNENEMTINNGLGYTEMKGSWFIFSKFSAHQDDCRWRAPFWHGSTVKSKKSHRNYHLGFRCCKDINKK